jgi:hypothetical protein
MKAIIQLRDAPLGRVIYQIQYEPSEEGVKVFLYQNIDGKLIQVCPVHVEDPRELMLKTHRICGEAHSLHSFGDKTDDDFINSLREEET